MGNKKLLIALLIFGAGLALGIALKMYPLFIGLGAGIGSAYYFNVRPKQ
ncbi:MAG: hypothetical protein ACPHGZ_03645 [Schleiferiaceae bacterium]